MSLPATGPRYRLAGGEGRGGEGRKPYEPPISNFTLTTWISCVRVRDKVQFLCATEQLLMQAGKGDLSHTSVRCSVSAVECSGRPPHPSSNSDFSR